MKKNKNFMLLLAAGAAYWYFAIYKKNKEQNTRGVMVAEDVEIQTALNMPNVPLIEVAPPRLTPRGFPEDLTFGGGINPGGMYNNSINVRYTMSGYRKLGKMPNTI